MFALKHIQKSYKDKPILKDICLSLNTGEVVALIGENGAGKTTLLRIALGELKPDSGTVSLHNEVVGYVPQQAEPKGIIQDSFSNRVEDWRADYALSLVELEGIPKTRMVNSLSGGQKTRLALAKVLASEPEPTMLLLDEPTNNLDVEGLHWLERFVKDYKGGIIIVSHDRNFINKVATSIVELCRGTLKQYGGNYDFYKQQKEIEYQSEISKYKSNLLERQRLTEAIKTESGKSQHTHNHIKRNDNDKYQRDFFRNRVTVKLGKNTKMLQARLKQLDEVERPEENKSYKVRLNGRVSLTKHILRANNIVKKYSDKTFAYPDFEIRGTERLHVQGANGSGKTTLLKIVAGLIVADSGNIELGQNIKLGYFSQDINGLNDSINNFENIELTGASPTAIYREARSLGLGETELRKKPDELSRGQQAKLSFVKILLSQNQLLIFDEPTNHLDFMTREQIEIALKNYKGSIIVASHDSYFLQRIGINRIINLDKEKIWHQVH